MTPESPAEFELKTLQLPASPGVPGGDVAYADVGEGPTVVLVHGYPGRPADYRWMIPALDGCRVVAPALPGMDSTPRSTCPSPSITGRGEFLAAFLDALDLTGVVAGHSMGAGLAGIAASLRPDRVTGLGLLAPIGLRPHRAFRRSAPKLSRALVDLPGMSWWTTPLMRTMFVLSGFPKGLSHGAMRFTLDCVAEMSFDDLVPHYAAVAVPTLIASCDDDPLIEPAISRELGDLMPAGPRLFFDTGLHGIVKSRAVEIGQALGAMARG